MLGRGAPSPPLSALFYLGVLKSDGVRRYVCRLLLPPTKDIMLGRAKSYFQPSKWTLEPNESTFAPSSRWSNKDMDPVPPSQRTWTTLNYVAYWISDATNAAVWELASSMLAVGLSW